VSILRALLAEAEAHRAPEAALTVADPIRSNWLAFSTCFEGVSPHLYLDIRGLVTVAIGALVDSPSAAAALTGWDNPGGVVADWHRVKAMPAGLVWTRYAAPSSPRLTPEGVEAVTLERLELAAAVLARTFPDFPSWPWQAQAATLSMAWAMGPGFASSWPRWAAFARARDWRSCASDCEIRWQDNVGVRPRNWANAALFLLAAGATDEEARAGWPAGPSAEVAGKALDALLVEAAAPTPRNTGEG
jgi:GH24 family phage-related lysozyme (muramidase)